MRMLWGIFFLLIGCTQVERISITCDMQCSMSGFKWSETVRIERKNSASTVHCVCEEVK